jgi:diguanylate cyclase (GGDEF)-like protein
VAFLVLTWEPARPWGADFAPAYRAVYFISIIQCWRFHRNRMMLALVVLALVDVMLAQYAGAGASAEGVGHIVYNLVAVLLPLNLLAVSLLPERGPFTVQGIAHWAAIVIQPAAVIQLLKSGNARLFGFLDVGFLGSARPAWTNVPDVSLLLFAVVFGVLLARYIWRPDAERNTVVWVIVACFMALGPGFGGLESTTYLATAGLMIIVSVADTSYRLAFQDALTGLPTRRGMYELIYQTSHAHYTVGMIDVDHFKAFNDKHGHDVGDQVLRMVAAVMAKVGGGGKAFRYGGEEFAVIFPGKRVEQTQENLEKLRATIAGRVFVIRGPGRPRKRPDNPKPADKRQALKVTVSIGAADNTFNEHEQPDEVIKAADEALYAAKQAGRNRTRIRAKPKI